MPSHIGDCLTVGVRVLILWLGTRGMAFAHASERGLVMLLPTHYYLLGGSLAVAISSVVLGLVPARLIRRVFAWRSGVFTVPAGVRLSLSWGSFFILALLLYAGFEGSRDPLTNLLPLTLWTVWWVGLNGINPLEFPGRSAVTWTNTVGLVATFVLLSAAYALAIWLGWRLTDRQGPFADHVGSFVLSIIPILLAFHFAHYLAVLLINGQYAMVAALEPFSQAFDLWGVAGYQVTGSWLTDHHSVALLWKLQAGAIVGGHLLAVVYAHALALKRYGHTRGAVLSQVPLTVFMVAYTLFGLWLLATPVAG